MSMIELTKTELDKYGVFEPHVNPYIEKIKQTIPFNISDKMKAVIAVTHMTTFTAQFRRNIVLWDGTEVPINNISFIVSGSGKNKDSSVNAAYKAFKPGYKLIEKRNADIIKQEAIKAATEAGEELPEEFEVYKSYLKLKVDVVTMPTTGPGLIDHINSTADMPLGSTLVSSSEFADELSYNQDMVENIKILSEVYDVGVKQAKHTKGAEFRSKSIEGASVNALFIGSPTYLLYDEATKKKFQIAFMSKLARRSWFCYSPEKIDEPDFDSMQKFYEYEDNLEASAIKARQSLEEEIVKVTNYNLNKTNAVITVSKEVERLFKTYKRYNNDLVDGSTNQNSTSALIRRHLQWKAIKFAGSLAILECSNEITTKHYVDALRFCELLDKDMEAFEHDLNKSNHERFSDFIRTQLDSEGKALISIHDIKKQGFVNSVSIPKLRELVTLCAGYDMDGIYTLTNEGSAIQYERIIKTDVLSISYMDIDNSIINKAIASGDDEAIKNAKQRVASMTQSGFDVVETTFAELADLLADDYAYSPFIFRDGVRGKDNIIGGTKWLVLDVDETVMSAEEAHFMLSAYNHHVALSSDPDNNYKYRILLELDSFVDLDRNQWKRFYLSVADDLGLRVDPLPQSQIFFSYADRKVFSNLEAEPIEVRDYVMAAKEEAERTLPGNYSTPQKRAQLNDPLNTFSYCYDAPIGQGSLAMYKMLQHAKDLGASYEKLIELLDDVNEYWSTDKGPMSQQRIDRLKEQAYELMGT